MKYSSDKPITKSSEDRYLRREYSKKLAKLLYEKNLKEDFVVGIYSKWGYGKSSVLAMVKEYIGTKAIVIPFNPWIFENQTAIVTALLYQLAKELDEHSPKPQNILQKAKDKITRNGALSAGDSADKLIKNYTGLVGVGLTLATGNGVAGTGTNAASELAQKYLKTSSIGDIKKRIEDKIALTGKRVIIVIDDLDRLDKDEIFRLLKLVKIIADFKGVTYLMAFDDEAVAAAINDRFSTRKGKDAGRAFLEKIIQVPLHLPLIPPSSLNKELLRGINTILKENKIEITDDDVRDFRSVFDENIAPLIDSPRTVTRYLNSLKFTMPFIAKEVNTADFLIIEALRLFYPLAYERLRNEKQLLTGTDRSFSFRDDSEEAELVKTRVSELSESNENVIEIVKSLFPVIHKKYLQTASVASLTELRREKRVASPDYYDRYFSYGLGADDISDTELIQILTLPLASDIAKKLSPLLKNKSQDLVLDKIKTYYKTVDSPLELAKAMVLLVSDLSKDNPDVFMDSPVEKSVDVIADIIKDSDDRLGSLKTIIEENMQPEQLFYLIREVVLNSKDDSHEKFLERDDFDNFKRYIAEKFRAMAEVNKFHGNGSLVGHILYQYWAEYGNRDEVNEYLKDVITNADEALDYVTLHLAKWNGSRGSHRGNFDRATYAHIEKTIDVEHLYNLIVDKYPELKGISKFTELEDLEGDVSKTGNENSAEFKKALAEQIVYLYEHPLPVEDS